MYMHTNQHKARVMSTYMYTLYNSCKFSKFIEVLHSVDSRVELSGVPTNPFLVVAELKWNHQHQSLVQFLYKQLDHGKNHSRVVSASALCNTTVRRVVLYVHDIRVWQMGVGWSCRKPATKYHILMKAQQWEILYSVSSLFGTRNSCAKFLSCLGPSSWGRRISECGASMEDHSQPMTMTMTTGTNDKKRCKRTKDSCLNWEIQVKYRIMNCQKKQFIRNLTHRAEKSLDLNYRLTFNIHNDDWTSTMIDQHKWIQTYIQYT